MRNGTFIWLIFCFMCFSGFGLETNMSKIIIYREHNHTGSAISYKVNANDSLIGRIRNNSWFSWECPPGEYTFDINGMVTTKINFNARENQTYYLRMGIKTGTWSNTIELILVDSLSAVPNISRGKMRNLQPSDEPLKRPKNRIGVQFGVGTGFEKTPIYITEDDRESKFSFGGGFGIGLMYGIELNKHFDLAMDMAYQSSGLSPALNNASWDFGRGIVTITPSVIIPIDDGYSMRVKIGAGLNYIWGTKLSIEGSKIPEGFNDTWDYSNSIGYHLKTAFELNFTESWSLLYGLKLYGAKFEFIEGGSRFPLINSLKNPSGTGLDLQVGLYYHF
jgi:hypothetical protein